MVPVVNRFAFPVSLDGHLAVRIQLGVEWILLDVLSQPAEIRGAVIPGIGADVTADLADVAGHGRQ